MQQDNTLSEIDAELSAFRIEASVDYEGYCHYAVSFAPSREQFDEVAKVEAECPFGSFGGSLIDITQRVQREPGLLSDDVLDSAARCVIGKWKRLFESPNRQVPRVVREWAAAHIQAPDLEYQFAGVTATTDKTEYTLDVGLSSGGPVDGAKLWMEAVTDGSARYGVGVSAAGSTVVWQAIGLSPFADYADNKMLSEYEQAYEATAAT